MKPLYLVTLNLVKKEKLQLYLYIFETFVGFNTTDITTQAVFQYIKYFMI